MEPPSPIDLGHDARRAAVVDHRGRDGERLRGAGADRRRREGEARDDRRGAQDRGKRAHDRVGTIAGGILRDEGEGEEPLGPRRRRDDAGEHLPRREDHAGRRDARLELERVQRRTVEGDGDGDAGHIPPGVRDDGDDLSGRRAAQHKGRRPPNDLRQADRRLRRG